MVSNRLQILRFSFDILQSRFQSVVDLGLGGSNDFQQRLEKDHGESQDIPTTPVVKAMEYYPNG
ncbi:hypothetical protein BFJ63_vAg1600 [Fusarium oxysporum f. sp. narcissi]|jgi:hypothetical protein|uniref:Uncharacterized protein n=1 Tax=Fusarium oxysporum f. sp. narcissi TaxID=451672 RepID=A0A4Q2W798_FUSOX|nr:hypothetical protein H9L39_08458 [Fusarium oxysporum f. sp. albedinis]RYC95787.1 hypothetical protein BFJ63_vAg1600 [Fusarium oxysporum f. sp. narcissi]